MATKKVARIVIGTPNARYQLTVPNMDQAQAKALIEGAKLRAHQTNLGTGVINGLIGYNTNYSLIFGFVNEDLEISDPVLFTHCFIKDENYGFDTPTINVHQLR